MRGIFFPQLVLSAQKRWQTIQVSCLFVLALVRFYLILLSSLNFLSSAFSMLLILNFFTSFVLNSEWWQEGLHLNLNPSPKQLFSSVNLCGIQNQHVVSLFFVPEEKWCRNYIPCRLISASHNLFKAAIYAAAGLRHLEAWRATSSQEWFRGGLHIDKIFLWKLLPQWLSVACWVCQMALGFVWLHWIFLYMRVCRLRKSLFRLAWPHSIRSRRSLWIFYCILGYILILNDECIFKHIKM